MDDNYYNIPSLKKFVEKGLSTTKDNRFQSVDEMILWFREIIEKKKIIKELFIEFNFWKNKENTWEKVIYGIILDKF